jgi:hypothetical protein
MHPEGCRRVNGVANGSAAVGRIAQSYVPDWQVLIRELEKEGFQPLLIRFNRSCPGEPISSLNVAARVRN